MEELNHKTKPYGVRTKDVKKPDDIRSFFDDIARDYTDMHGNPGRLLRYRSKLLIREACLQGNETLVEIGCGTGDHILGVGKEVQKRIGVDFSPEMIRRANTRILGTELTSSISFQVDDATRLKTISDSSVDVVFCVGSLEHIPDKAAVFASVNRVLKPGGRFICLTVNGGYLWYHTIAPLLRYNTHHLSTDQFLIRNDIIQLASEAGFKSQRIGYWSFIPCGDMPPLAEFLFRMLDMAGRLFRVASFRGGISFTIVR